MDVRAGRCASRKLASNLTLLLLLMDVAQSASLEKHAGIGTSQTEN